MNFDYLAIDKEVVKSDPKRPLLLLRPDLGVSHETSRAAMDATAVLTAWTPNKYMGVKHDSAKMKRMPECLSLIQFFDRFRSPFPAENPHWPVIDKDGFLSKGELDLLRTPRNGRRGCEIKK